MVPRGVERQRDTRLHPRPKATQDAGKIRQALIQAAKPHRDHVWQAQGLEARGNTLRQVSESLPIRHRTRGSSHLLVMNPDPRTTFGENLYRTGGVGLKNCQQPRLQSVVQEKSATKQTFAASAALDLSDGGNA